MKFLILALTPLLFSYANAEEVNFNAIELNDIKSIQVNKVEIELPVPMPKVIIQEKCDYVSGEIKEFHLLAQTAKKLIYTHADTQEEFDAFLNKWTPILELAGLKPTETEFKHTMGIQHYSSDNDLVLRDFWADKLNYDALASTEIHKLQHELVMSLEKEDMPTVAAFRINNDYVRPTFKLFYVTKYNENPDHEVRLRHLMKGNDIDYDILEKAGVNIVRKDRAFSMVYIGKELGFVTRFGKSEEAIKTKIEEYKKFLIEYDKEFIGSRIVEFDEPFYEYTHAVKLYFYQ